MLTPEITGSFSAENYDFEVSKGCSTAQHINPQRCFVGTEQKLYCFCELPRFQVSFVMEYMLSKFIFTSVTACLFPSHTDRISSFSSNEYAQLEGKKTIQPADVIAALKENEFEHFIPRLEAELKSDIHCISAKVHQI